MSARVSFYFFTSLRTYFLGVYNLLDDQYCYYELVSVKSRFGDVVIEAVLLYSYFCLASRTASHR